MIIHFADGRKFKGVYKNGKRNGNSIEVDKDGKRTEGEYKDDLKDGKFIIKDRNGNITAQEMYRMGRKS